MEALIEDKKIKRLIYRLFLFMVVTVTLVTTILIYRVGISLNYQAEEDPLQADAENADIKI